MMKTKLPSLCYVLVYSSGVECFRRTLYPMLRLYYCDPSHIVPQDPAVGWNIDPFRSYLSSVQLSKQLRTPRKFHIHPSPFIRVLTRAAEITAALRDAKSTRHGVLSPP